LCLSWKAGVGVYIFALPKRKKGGGVEVLTVDEACRFSERLKDASKIWQSGKSGCIFAVRF
jgi:hypothetical protein